MHFHRKERIKDTFVVLMGSCQDLCPGPVSQFSEFSVSVSGSRGVVTSVSGILVHVTILGVHYVSWQCVSEHLSDLLLTFLCVILYKLRSVTKWKCSNFFLNIGMWQLSKSALFQRCNEAFGSKSKTIVKNQVWLCNCEYKWWKFTYVIPFCFLFSFYCFFFLFIKVVLLIVFCMLWNVGILYQCNNDKYEFQAEEN